MIEVAVLLGLIAPWVSPLAVWMKLMIDAFALLLGGILLQL